MFFNVCGCVSVEWVWVPHCLCVGGCLQMQSHVNPIEFTSNEIHTMNNMYLLFCTILRLWVIRGIIVILMLHVKHVDACRGLGLSQSARMLDACMSPLRSITETFTCFSKSGTWPKLGMTPLIVFSLSWLSRFGKLAVRSFSLFSNSQHSASFLHKPNYKHPIPNELSHPHQIKSQQIMQIYVQGQIIY